jgi:GT2 family glycosyltransferase
MEPERLPPSDRISVGIVTYRSDIGLFRTLTRSLVSDLRRCLNATQTATICLMCNDGDRRFPDLVAAHLRSEGFCDRIRLTTFVDQGNIGYGAANNLAIQASQAEFHLILNPDVALAPDALAHALRYLEEDAEAVLVAPQAYNAGGSYVRLAKRGPSPLIFLLRALSVAPSDGFFGSKIARYVYAHELPANEPREIELASGCCMLCRTADLKRVGAFDERFFLYFEDYDLSARLRQAGKLVEVPGFCISHFGGWATKRQPRRIGHFLVSAVRYFSLHGWRLL